jgi:hypothetical protein
VKGAVPKLAPGISEPQKPPLPVVNRSDPLMPSRGSSSSLTAMEHGTSLAAGPMGELSKSSQLLFAQEPPSSSLHHVASKTSLVSNDDEIAYAKLDLTSSCEDNGCLGGGAAAAASKSRHSSAEEVEGSPLQYAEIDFETSTESVKKSK